MNELQELIQAVITWPSRHVDALWSTAVAAAVIAFLLKLGRDFVVDKIRQAANVRVVAVYIKMAIGTWDALATPGTLNVPFGQRLASLDSLISATLLDHPSQRAGRERYTPFVVYARQNDLTIAEVRELLGFLNRKAVEEVVDFIQLEAMVHTFAEDFKERIRPTRIYAKEESRTFPLLQRHSG